VGETLTYDAAFTTDVSVALDVLFPSATIRASAGLERVKAEWSGTMTERALDPAAHVGLVRIEQPRYTLAGQPDPEVEAALKKGVVIERDDDGRVLRLRVPKSLGRAARVALRTMADALEWSNGPVGTASWASEDPGAQGTVAARYETTDAGPGRLAFTRRIVRLVHAGSRPPGPAFSTDERAELRGELDVPRMRFSSVTGTHTVAQANARGATVSTQSTQVSLVRTGTATDVPAAAIFNATIDDAFEPWIPIDDSSGDAPRFDERAKEAMLAGRTPQQVIAGLRSGDPSQITEAASALRLLLELHPEAAAEIARDAARGAPGERGTGIELSALVSNGSAEAQRGLTTVLDAWKGKPYAASAATLFASVHAPTAQTVDYLLALRGDHGAELGPTLDTTLGSVAAHLRESDPVRADAIAQEFEKRLRGSTDTSQIAQTLVALGNTRSERITDVAPDYVQSSDPRIRQMAVYALGNAQEDAARDVIRQMAATDPDPQVRAEAARALASNPS
jgi:hypothetical protein